MLKARHIQKFQNGGSIDTAAMTADLKKDVRFFRDKHFTKSGKKRLAAIQEIQTNQDNGLSYDINDNGETFSIKDAEGKKVDNTTGRGLDVGESRLTLTRHKKNKKEVSKTLYNAVKGDYFKKDEVIEDKPITEDGEDADNETLPAKEPPVKNESGVDLKVEGYKEKETPINASEVKYDGNFFMTEDEFNALTPEEQRVVLADFNRDAEEMGGDPDALWRVNRGVLNENKGPEGKVKQVVHDQAYDDMEYNNPNHVVVNDTPEKKLAAENRRKSEMLSAIYGLSDEEKTLDDLHADPVVGGSRADEYDDLAKKMVERGTHTYNSETGELVKIDTPVAGEKTSSETESRIKSRQDGYDDMAKKMVDQGTHTYNPETRELKKVEGAVAVAEVKTLDDLHADPAPTGNSEGLITITELGAGNSRKFTDDERYNTLVNKKISQGTHGYDPATGALVKLETPLKGAPVKRNYDDMPYTNPNYVVVNDTEEKKLAAINKKSSRMLSAMYGLSDKEKTEEFVPPTGSNVVNLDEATVTGYKDKKGSMGSIVRGYHEPNDIFFEDDLLRTISTGEGTTDERAAEEGYASGYDVTLGYGAFDPEGFDKPVSQMTLGEIDKFQRGMLKHPDNDLNSSALGKYQIVGETLRGLKKTLGLTDDMVYTPELQEKLGRELLKQRGLAAFRSNPKDGANKFLDEISKEWASMLNSVGLSYYSKEDKARRAKLKLRNGGRVPMYQAGTNEIPMGSELDNPLLDLLFKEEEPVALVKKKVTAFGDFLSNLPSILGSEGNSSYPATIDTSTETPSVEELSPELQAIIKAEAAERGYEPGSGGDQRFIDENRRKVKNLIRQEASDRKKNGMLKQEGGEKEKTETGESNTNKDGKGKFGSKVGGLLDTFQANDFMQAYLAWKAANTPVEIVETPERQHTDIRKNDIRAEQNISPEILNDFRNNISSTYTSPKSSDAVMNLVSGLAAGNQKAVAYGKLATQQADQKYKEGLRVDTQKAANVAIDSQNDLNKENVRYSNSMGKYKDDAMMLSLNQQKESERLANIGKLSADIQGRYNTNKANEEKYKATEAGMMNKAAYDNAYNDYFKAKDKFTMENMGKVPTDGIKAEIEAYQALTDYDPNKLAEYQSYLDEATKRNNAIDALGAELIPKKERFDAASAAMNTPLENYPGSGFFSNLFKPK